MSEDYQIVYVDNPHDSVWKATGECCFLTKNSSPWERHENQANETHHHD
jgi:hypothetical protein